MIQQLNLIAPATASTPRPVSIEASELASRRQMVELWRREIGEDFVLSTERRENEHMERMCRDLRRCNELVDWLVALEPTAPPPRLPNQYRISSYFLHHCAELLTRQPEEQFVFVTGPIVEHCFVIDQLIEFRHERQTVVGVVGDTRETHRRLIELGQFGHRLLATFHSHPGTGPESTRPSGIDERYQGRLEQAGHIALMGIFSRGGFVRLFRLNQQPTISMYGEGVEQYEPNVYRLAAYNRASGPIHSGSDGSATAHSRV